ncbi:DNA repair and recombination helicase protein PIF6 [Novymonas esmeraldas]|uniref:ATP-dependent DNA helicase n=1 Tax=Novymonas esmeraldas TaxID=1808958 RepID=A0AAW0EME2_9TRYP
MAAVAVRVPVPKLTVSAVHGKITVFAEDGERIGQWGGTGCFLSRQGGLGPCLVVRSSRHKAHEGTFFQLARLQRVVSTHVALGRLTVMVPHERRQCTVFIDTTDDLDALRMMAGVLQDRARWADMERNVASSSRKALRRGNSGDGGGGGGGGGRAALRDPSRAALSGRGAESDEDEDEDEESVHGGDAQRTRTHAAPAGPPLTTSAGSPAHTGTETNTGEAAAAQHSCPPPRAKAVAQPPSSWTREQHHALQLVRAGHNVFVSGAAGTGKTEWLRYVLEHVLSPAPSGTDAVDAGRVAVTAATGIAARLIGGHTVHAFAGIGRGEGDAEAVLQRVQSKPDAVRAWQRCEVLVVDEISMVSAHTFALLDRIGRVLRRPPHSSSSSSSSPRLAPGGGARAPHTVDRPFGGVQLLVVGDFLQLPPVSRGAGEEARPAFTAAAWRACAFRSVAFVEDHRHAGDRRFAECCAAVRRGECTPLVRTVLESCVGRELEERFGVEATTLLARRQDVDRYNAQRLQQLDSMAFQRYASEDYAAVPGTDMDSEVSLPAVLTLKAGAQVVLLASLPDAPHLANGNVGRVVGFVAQTRGPALPRVCFTTGAEVVVPAVTMEVYGRDGRLRLSRRQVPLQLAWALTVHRVQGMTLPMVRLALDKSFFESGQAYVALSRVRTAADLCLTALDLDVVTAWVSPEAREFYEVAGVASPPTGTRSGNSSSGGGGGGVLEKAAKGDAA